nr:zinc finger, CCHC-type [Tanacetum cinerariifolium]
MFKLNIVNDNIGSTFMLASKLNNSILWHARLGHLHYKRMQDMSNDGDAIFDENRFFLVSRPSFRTSNGTEDIGGSMVPEEATKKVVQQPKSKLRKSKKNRNSKNFGPEFQLYLLEGTRDEKEAINDEMDSIMGKNTWVLADLLQGYKPLGCKWIFKRKLKVDGAIEKFKARLVIQSFKQKSGIDYFDTYNPMTRISTIRLLIAMSSIHNLIIHQMDVKTSFLNGELEEGVYINQPQGFIMPVNKNKVCKLIKSLYGLKQVDLTKEFLTSRFSMKDMGEADVILGLILLLQRELKYLKKTMDYSLIYTSDPSVLKGYTYASWISNTEDNSSTNGLVFLLGRGSISWASKKQTCITGATMESKFVALAAAGKEAE